MLDDLIEALQKIRDDNLNKDINVLSRGDDGVNLLSSKLTLQDNWLIIEPEDDYKKLQEVFS